MGKIAFLQDDPPYLRWAVRSEAISDALRDLQVLVFLSMRAFFVPCAR